MEIPINILNTVNSIIQKKELKNLISKYNIPICSDYIDDFNRGTTKYNIDSKNYCYHKVVIPNESIIKESNFSQKEPYTDCIAGKNLTFENCNLVNVIIDKSWTLKNCNNTQIKKVIVKDSGIEEGEELALGTTLDTFFNKYTNKTYEKKNALISFQIEKLGEWVEVKQKIEDVVSEKK